MHVDFKYEGFIKVNPKNKAPDSIHKQKIDTGNMKKQLFAY
jgi:hypothetical protein